jgi:hypothetical protein
MLEGEISLGYRGLSIRILLKRILKVYGVIVDWIYLDQDRVYPFLRK